MPEGPSIVILKETVEEFNGKKIIGATGNAKIDFSRMENEAVHFRTWGKHFLMCFKGFTVRIHLLMFGTYLINERKALEPKLSLTFKNGELNFYTCNVKLLEGDVNDHYDWAGDVMNDNWDGKKAMAKLKTRPEELICDALLEQDIFSGVGNIIKNEVLYRVRVQPESAVGKITPAKLKELINEARNYSFEFLKWKQQGELKKHWLAHTKKTCMRCDLPIIKEYTGTKKRRSFYCENCQKLYQ
jgi:endonuclease-8